VWGKGVPLLKKRLYPVFKMEPSLTFAAILQRLDYCYDQLLQVLTDARPEPEQILELAEETVALLARLTDYPVEKGEIEPRLQLENLFHKLQQVIKVTVDEKDKIYQSMLKLKTSKRVFQSYRPPAVGMGYTEGKFLDQKK
jgi:hypothetical protein